MSDFNELVKLALIAKEKAYAPYSKFHVGAAVLTGSGKTYTGCNIESASYGATCCAERTAVFKAVSDGEKVISVVAVASDSDKSTFPCGICRQVIAEFASKDCRILCCSSDGTYEIFTLNEILPHAFTGGSMESGG